MLTGVLLLHALLDGPSRRQDACESVFSSLSCFHTSLVSGSRGMALGHDTPGTSLLRATGGVVVRVWYLKSVHGVTDVPVVP